MIKLFKNPLFLIGFVFIVGLVTASFIYSHIVNNEVKQIYHIYGEDNELVDSAPIAPRKEALLGTDKLGYDMLSKVLIGAKFTILAALIIAILRMVISVPIGLIVGTYFSKTKKYLNSLVDAFHFIPLTIIALYLLQPVLYMRPEGFTYSLTERMGIEILVLAILTVPILSVLIGNEAGELLKSEYVISAKTLGGSNLHIIVKHIIPIMKDRFFILFGQQFVQTLIVMAHLGLFNLYFGGTLVSFDKMGTDPPQSMTNEWSGLIGGTKIFLQWAPWIPLTPIICFALTILAVSFMVEGFSRVTTGRPVYFKKRKKFNEDRMNKMDIESRSDQFKLLNKSS
ncbi:ABC transporter permease subunit [Metabacillus litoralis]|uniref:ABC transporter permease subunit n=1 Tax=Metabacillus litoralis TaxID=152268 RepID=A0A5C6VVL6_9BACI|nr:ABC transporter permease subunit [Metabacillus litoralis]TXC89463.1 ABC transporter permease subunit [Metabacillus litoralis]